MQKVLGCLCLHVQIKAATEKVVTLKPQDITGRQTDRQTDSQGRIETHLHKNTMEDTFH